MEKIIFIQKAIDEGNVKLFREGKPTYRGLHEISREISERTNIPQKNIFYLLQRYSKGLSRFSAKNHELIIDTFFELLELKKEDYMPCS